MPSPRLYISTMSDAICFTGAPSGESHHIISKTTYTQPLNFSGYQDSEFVLIAIDLATVVMDNRQGSCIVLEKGERRTTHYDFVDDARVYTLYAEFLSSGAITCEWGDNKPLHTRITVIGF